MQGQYVEIRNGGYYVAGSRVSLASIVYEYRDGAAAETIRQNLPTLSLEALQGDRAGQHSIRINDQWRICFVWRDGEAHDVEIVDYH
jgi:proteic killer suppression protein